MTLLHHPKRPSPAVKERDKLISELQNELARRKAAHKLDQHAYYTTLDNLTTALQNRDQHIADLEKNSIEETKKNPWAYLKSHNACDCLFWFTLGGTAFSLLIGLTHAY